MGPLMRSGPIFFLLFKGERRAVLAERQRSTFAPFPWSFLWQLIPTQPP